MNPSSISRSESASSNRSSVTTAEVPGSRSERSVMVRVGAGLRASHHSRAEPRAGAGTVKPVLPTPQSAGLRTVCLTSARPKFPASRRSEGWPWRPTAGLASHPRPGWARGRFESPWGVRIADAPIVQPPEESSRSAILTLRAPGGFASSSAGSTKFVPYGTAGLSDRAILIACKDRKQSLSI